MVNFEQALTLYFLTTLDSFYAHVNWNTWGTWGVYVTDCIG